MINIYTSAPIQFVGALKGQTDLILHLEDEYNNVTYDFAVNVECIDNSVINITTNDDIPYGLYNYTLRTCQVPVSTYRFGCLYLGANCGKLYMKGKVIARGMLNVRRSYYFIENKPNNIVV